jgi:hypothetical protein
MKKLIFALVILGALSAPLFAQKISEGKESDYFYVNVPIEKIYSYKKGYVVQYRKGANQIAEVYLPMEWFSGTGAETKGELAYQGSGADWPSMTVYYKSGEFSHVRLYVRRDQRHASWGFLPQGTNLDDRFENVEDLRLDF